MLRAGAVLLTFWAGVHLVLALGILAMMLVLGRNSPALLVLFGDTQGAGVDARALATINALAVLCNAWRAAMCVASLTVIWGALVRRAAWAFWTLAACACLLQAAGFASDSLLGRRELLGNAAASLVPLAGVVLAAVGVFRRPSAPAVAPQGLVR